MLIVDVFRAENKVVDVDTSLGRTEVWELVKAKLPGTDQALLNTPLTERSECLLGMRPWPKKQKACIL